MVKTVILQFEKGVLDVVVYSCFTVIVYLKREEAFDW